MNSHTSTARISDQLDAPIIDHELQKMLLPKILDMFQFIKEPISTNNTTTSRSSPTSTERVNLSLHTPSTNTSNTNTEEQRSSFSSYLHSITSLIQNISVIPNLQSIWQSSFESQEQKEEMIQFLSQIVFFVLTHGRERPTPAMTLLGLRLIPYSSHSIPTSRRHRLSSIVVGKRRLVMLLFFSIGLPKLYDYFMRYYLFSNLEYSNDNRDPLLQNIGTNEEQHDRNLSSDDNHSISMESRARIRRKILLRKIHQLISKVIPLLRLWNYVSFLYATSHSVETSSSVPPPTLAMRLAGVCYADIQTHFFIPIYKPPSQSNPSSSKPLPTKTATQSSYSSSPRVHQDPLPSSSSSSSPASTIPTINSSPSHRNKPINYIYAHRRLLYLELMRSFWAILPFSPSQVSQWNQTVTLSSIKHEIQEYLQFFKQKVLLQKKKSDPSRTVKHGSHTPQEIASIPCSICKISPIPIPYVTSCGHLYCYTCLRNAIVKMETDEWSLLPCKECGTNIRESFPLKS